jgi:hypothetical protein
MHHDSGASAPPPHPALSAADVAYVTGDFVTLTGACAGRPETPGDVRRLMEARRLPRATYVLADATELVPHDYFSLADDAGGLDALPGWFARRLGQELVARGLDASAERIATEWDGYLSGEYGACLRRVSPEGIAEKARLMAAIEAAIASPRTGDAGWRSALRRDVDRLDGMLRAFAAWDRQRFGGPVSRDRLVTAVRVRFGEVWAEIVGERDRDDRDRVEG